MKPGQRVSTPLGEGRIVKGTDRPLGAGWLVMIESKVEWFPAAEVIQIGGLR